MSEELQLLQRRFDRERLARKAAEAALEQESLKLYHANEQLRVANSRLEGEVVEQTTARQQVEARAAGIVDAALDAVIAADAGGRVVAWNPQAEAVFGWSAGEVMGRPLVGLIVPAADRDPPRGLAQALARPHAQGERLEAAAVHRTGRTFTAEVAITSAGSATGDVLSVFVRDVSERVQYEQRRLMMYRVAGVLAEAQTVADARRDVLKTVTQTMGWDVGMSWRLDDDDVLRFTSEWTALPGPVPLIEMSRGYAFARGVGLPGRVLQNQAPAWLVDLAADENFPRRTAALASGMKAGLAVPVISGSRVVGVMEFFFKESREPDPDLLNVLTSVGSQVKQFVQRRMAEEAAERARRDAEQASAAKSEFLAKMSHEIRTPLNGIVGIVDLMADTQLDEQQHRFLKIAKSSSDSLLSIINDVLDFSKIEAGHMELEAVAFSPGRVLDEVVDGFSSQADKKGIELGAAVAPSADRAVVGDPARFRQVLVNLIGNAIKFTKAGRVIIRMSRDDGPASLLRLEVDDSGIGIPPDKMGRLFKSFSQADASTTRTYGGTGLGLAISKRLVQMMGGDIGVRPNATAGSTFWFTAKLDAAAEPTAPQHADDARGGLRVLIADDSAAATEVLTTLLSQWGYAVEMAPTAADALRHVRDANAAGRPFDVALVDVRLPDDAGRSLAARVREDAALDRTRLIAVGGITERLDAAFLANGRYDAGVTKPLKPSRLFDAIATSGRHQRPAAAPEFPNAARESVAPAGARVLVAEDNEVNQFIVRKMLTARGYACDVVANGRLAVEATERQAYDLVLMDCSMPEMDGFEATRQIRRREHATADARRLPIVALTAEALNGDREKCRALGMDDYIVKPIEPALLFGTLGRLIAAARASATPQAARPPATANSSAGRDAPVDYAALLDRSLGDAEFARDTLKMFLGRAEEDLAALRRSAAGNAAAEVERLAHGLKGVAGHVGATAVRSAAAALEASARADGPAADAPLRALADALAEANAYIRQTLLADVGFEVGVNG